MAGRGLILQNKDNWFPEGFCLKLSLAEDDYIIGLAVHEDRLYAVSKHGRKWVSTDVPVKHLDMVEITK